MTEHFHIAIIGSGPSGMSAAARAAESGVSHILLEAEAQPANVIRSFQKGKHVMAEPRALPLRSRISFAANTRENVLHTWESELEAYAINFRANSLVTGIRKASNIFRITLASGDALTADFVILAIGLQSNVRKLDVPGADHPRVQYHLDDPEEFSGERIVVVGGGDTSIENALALMPNNSVIFITRQEGFFNCKPDNENQLIAAVGRGDIELRLDTRVDSVIWTEGAAHPLTLVADAPLGKEHLPCDRIIARLGAEPPRALLESFGIRFPNADPASAPLLSQKYESSVPGLYIVGALAGYPLIKQALNQGHEVVHHILGIDIKPVDEELLEEKFRACPHISSVEEGLERIRSTIPLLAALSPLQLRDFMLESALVTFDPGDVVFDRNDYSTSLYCILEGSVDVYAKGDEHANFAINSGEFFGELGLISGRRRSTTIKARSHCLLIEAPRQAILSLSHSMESVQRMIDEVSLKRAVQLYVGLSLSASELDYLVHDAKIKSFSAGDVLWHQGDRADGLYLIRSGSVTVSRMIGGKETVLSYVAAGNYVGEMALVSGRPRYATVRAAVATQAILLGAERVAEIMERNPEIQIQLNDRYLENMQTGFADELMQAGSDSGNLISFLVQQGIGEATDVLLIDETICTRCDNCEKACADTHDGTSRLERKSGPVYDQIRVPSSCRHCEHPHCMKDCPPDAIRRSVEGEVFINDTCIGCGNCVTNCPYGVIQMATIDLDRKPTGVWQWLLGLGPEPGTRASTTQQTASKLAVKCDMCKDLADGPACVRSCPTGAAIRVDPQEFLDYAVWRKSKVN